MSCKWSKFFSFGCTLWSLENTLSRKKQPENDKEDTFNISSCDNHQWDNDYKDTKQIQYSQLKLFTINCAITVYGRHKIVSLYLHKFMYAWSFIHFKLSDPINIWLVIVITSKTIAVQWVTIFKKVLGISHI